ncbi:hypothetical protein D918_03558 [Trichuris suis]|nr:hypothetical protein D918_03558 [Trichuris suis]
MDEWFARVESPSLGGRCSNLLSSHDDERFTCMEHNFLDRCSGMDVLLFVFAAAVCLSRTFSAVVVFSVLVFLRRF